MNKDRKSTVKKSVFAVIVLALLLALIGGTYARYSSTGAGTATAQVAKWAVKINNVDIVDNNSFTVTFNEVDNANVVDGKIAPSSQLYADFEIDPTGSEVAIDYSFALGTITASEGNVPTDLKVSKVCTISGADETELTAGEGSKYTGTIDLASQTEALTADDKVKVRVYVEWQNTADSDAAHTTVGKAAPTLSMEVTGTATQHI